YETYDDVRLVMAPENDVGQFGHDQDNFDYPRHGLDMAFVRIYRDGKPVTPSDYLEWSAEGPQKDEPLFVSGHPGGTERYLTVAQLRRQRDQALPLILQALGLQRQALLDIAAESPARSLEVASLLADVDNSIKAYRGGQAGLADPQVWAKKEAQEKALRDAIAADPKLQKKYGRVFGDIERLETRSAADFRERVYRGVVHGTGAQLPELAAALLQSAKEIAKTKPGERDEARAAAIEAIQEKFEHLVSVPGFQEKALTASLELSRRVLGDKDPFVRDVLSGRTPAEAARAAVGATRIADPAEWARLLAGDASAALHSADPVFALARAIEHHAAPLRERHEREVTRPEEKAKNLLGAAWRAAYGAALYPDADFTLRLSYGQMRGFETRGKELPARTTFFGLFEKNESYENAFPYALPDSVRGCRPGVDLCTPLNFVTDNDIIGGNSGSPMVNRQGRVVGLVFDGNWEGLANEHVFSARDRTIAVDSRAVLHALTHIYKMDALAREIAGTTAARLARMPGAPPQETHD
ncbi:MAG TPA: S46 family peptidase, partial [Elusimicrobiota bacterium]|nr:S46 family peptidase [Elusimicrobiota bacterium]